jgi:hypothetical protein
MAIHQKPVSIGKRCQLKHYTGQRRFCSVCGKNMQVVAVRFIEYDAESGKEVWEAVCEKGHYFTGTLFGLPVILL